jgi:5'-nucleotidase
VQEVTLADGSLAYASDGAPSDCVALAVMGLINHPVDIIVAGINPAANLGHDVTYSGTVTAVMEGIIWGIPGVAISLDGKRLKAHEFDYSTPARIARLIVRTIVETGLPKGAFLNVNVPNIPAEQLRGIRNTRQGLRVYRDHLEKRQDPRGRDYYWIGGDTPTGIAEDGTDVGALAKNFASVTPLQLDLTAYPALSNLVNWQWNFAKEPW